MKTRIDIMMKRGDDAIEITRTIPGNNIIDITDAIQEIVLDTVPDARLIYIYFSEVIECQPSPE